MDTHVKNHLALGKETTYGTAVTPDFTFPIAFSGGLVTDPQREYLSALRSQLAKYYAAVDGARVHSGDFEADLLHDAAGYVFLSALGSVSSALAAGETTVYEHDFTESESKTSYTVEQKIGQLVRRYAGVVFPSFKITAEPSGAVKLGFSAIGKSNDSATAITPAPTNEKPFVFDEVDVKIDSSSVSGVSKLELEYKNGAELVHALGSVDPHGFVIAGSELDGTMELILDATTATEYTNFLNGTEKQLDLVITGPSIGNSSNYKLEITVPKVVYKTAEINYSDSGAIILPIAFSAVSVSGSLFSTFKLTNLKASY